MPARPGLTYHSKSRKAVSVTSILVAKSTFISTPYSLGMLRSSNLNPNVVRFQQFFANLKYNGFSDSFYVAFGFNFCFEKPYHS